MIILTYVPSLLTYMRGPLGIKRKTPRGISSMITKIHVAPPVKLQMMSIENSILEAVLCKTTIFRKKKMKKKKNRINFNDSLCIKCWFLIFRLPQLWPANYSDLPNNCAANLIIFQEKNTYTTLLGPTRLLISEIFLSNPDFHLHKWEKILRTQPY